MPWKDVRTLSAEGFDTHMPWKDVRMRIQLAKGGDPHTPLHDDLAGGTYCKYLLIKGCNDVMKKL